MLCPCSHISWVVFILTCPYPHGFFSSSVSYLRCTGYTFLTLLLGWHCFSELCRDTRGSLVRQKVFWKGFSAFCPKGPRPPSTVAPSVFPALCVSTAPCTLALPLPPAPGQADLPAVHCMLFSPANVSLHVYLQNFPDSLHFVKPSLHSQNSRLEMPSLEPSHPPRQVPRTCSELVGMLVARLLHDHEEGFVLLTSAWRTLEAHLRLSAFLSSKTCSLTLPGSELVLS